MSEEPTDIGNVGQSDDQVEGWRRVAGAMRTEGWHPGLQTHVVRHLARVGIQDPAVSEGSGDVVAVEAPAEALSVKPERPTVSAEKIAEAFATGQAAFYKLGIDPDLHDRLLKQKIDPYADAGTPKYWKVFAGFARERVSHIREKRGDSVQLRAFELMTATPEFLLTQQALDNNTHRHSNAGDSSKEVVTQFNRLVSGFARSFPESRSAKLSSVMQNTANIAFGYRALNASVSRSITEVIRGMQHELGYGQVLDAIGRKHRQSTEGEDRDQKFDELVEGTGGRWLKVDIKASLSDIEARGSEKPYAISNEGVIKMYSLLRDSDFGGRFFISDEVARERGAKMDELLSEAEQDLLVNAA